MKRLSFAVGAWVVAVTVVALAAQEPKSVNEGVYTAAQADRGAAVFKTSCTACHDTARFTGDEFLAGWTG
jgi:cytochrome c5